MTSPLVEAFRSELPCTENVAASLASLARDRLPRLAGTWEDTEEDLVLRLRDPRTFGDFVESLEGDRRVPESTHALLLDHVFDLLPLPRAEGDVIAVETRAPRHLLSFAASLAGAGGLSVLHVMHVVYAVFLDRSLVTRVPRKTRAAVLRAIVREGGSGESLRVLYACLHLATVPESESASEFTRILEDREVSVGLRRSLASLAAAEDGAHASLTRIAQREGLLPEAIDDAQAQSVLASIPRLPQRLHPIGLRFLEGAQSR